MGSKSSIAASLQVGEGTKTKFHLVPCFAPVREGRQVKDAFFQDFERILAAIPAGERYVIYCDFNAHVGSRECVNDWWGLVKGTHGYQGSSMRLVKSLSFFSMSI